MPSIKSHPIGFAKATVLLLAILAGGAVLAHEHAVGITAERMQVMKDMASHMKALGEMLEGRVAYDAAAARENALALHENCHEVASQFPEEPMTITAGLVQRSGSNPRSLGRRWTTSSVRSANWSPQRRRDSVM